MADARKEGSFFWFPESSSVELARRIQAAGPGHRLEVRISASDKMTFRVVQKGATAFAVSEPDVNDSYICPTVCPD